MDTQNESQNLAKISSKSTIVHSSMNICRSFVFREILKEVRPVELQGEAFPALSFLSYVWVSQNSKLPVTSRTRFVACVFVFVLFFNNGRKFDLASL